MQDNAQLTHSQQALSEPFTIQLTKKQAEFLAKLLPQRYSLQPEHRKKGQRSKKKPLKDVKRTNLPSRIPQITKQVTTYPPVASSIISQTPSKDRQSSAEHEPNGQTNEQTLVAQEMPLIDRKRDGGATNEWRLNFLQEARKHALFVRAYGKVFDLLQERIRGKILSEEDFHDTMLKVISDQKMRSTKRGEQLSDQLKTVYLKHRRSFSSINKASQAKKEQSSQTKNISFPQKRQNSPNKVAQKPGVSNKNRTGSESSSDLGVDFDLRQVSVPKPTINMAGNSSMQATFTYQSMCKLPPSELTRLQTKYGITSIDVQTIKALPASILAQLFLQLKSFIQKSPMIIADFQESRREDEESSFQIEDD